MRTCKTLSAFWRELKGYFDSPVAYAFLVAFLVMVNSLTFCVSRYYELEQAVLTPFFLWHPWSYLLLVPAATMGSWADGRRACTVEQLLALPVTVTSVLVGKFLAAWAFCGVSLLLTFPILVTTAYLGGPNWNAVICGYAGSFLFAGAAAATALFASSFARSRRGGFAAALALLAALTSMGFGPALDALAGWGVPGCVVGALSSCSPLAHYASLSHGVLDFADVVYYIGAIAFMLSAAKYVADCRNAP